MNALLAAMASCGFPVFIGYVPSNNSPPYGVMRPLYLSGAHMPISGSSIVYNNSVGVYCCALSVEASYNMAKRLVTLLDGYTLFNTQLNVSSTYVGAKVEQWFESLVTINFTTNTPI